MSSVYDGNLTVSIFGQSHAPAIGVTIDGLPAGLPVDLDALGRFLRRRAPGQNAWSTPRKEADLPEFLCGLKDGRTCGAPLTAIIRNTNTRSGDYENLMDIPRPGHADYTAQVKFGGAQDAAGGGHFSGRLTAPLCIAGGLCLQILAQQGVRVRARKECRVPVLFFQVIEGGIFGKDKAVILYVVHFRQPGALFPKLHEDVEHNFLRPFFVLHEIAGNTEQAVVAQIVETVKSPFRVFFLHLA